jgi:hypothetical protein
VNGFMVRSPTYTFRSQIPTWLPQNMSTPEYRGAGPQTQYYSVERGAVQLDPVAHTDNDKIKKDRHVTQQSKAFGKGRLVPVIRGIALASFLTVRKTCSAFT